jgi:WD40 repeat protein
MPRMTPIFFELEDPVIGLAWSPDGRRVAAAGISGPGAIIETATGCALQRLAGHKGGTLAIAWSAQGDVIATGGQDGKVRLWSPNTGVCQRELDGGAAWVEQVAFSPDDTTLATAAGKRLRLWNTNGEMLFEFAEHESTVSALQWRADGKGIATACYGKIRCFRMGTAKPYETLNWKSSFISIAWSPNGRFLCAGTQENTVQFFRLPARGEEPLRMSGYPAKVKQLAWDRDTRFLASGGGDEVTVWDVSGKGPAGRIPLQLAGHLGKISALAYQRRGNVLASGCESGTVILWNPSRSKWPINKPVPIEKCLHTARLLGSINQICWSEDESMLAIGCQDGTVAFLSAPAT